MQLQTYLCQQRQRHDKNKQIIITQSNITLKVMLSHWISSWCDDLWYTFYTRTNFRIEICVSGGKTMIKKKKPKQIIITIFKLLSTGLSNVCRTVIQSTWWSSVHFRHKNQFQARDVISDRKLTEVFWWPKMAYIKSRWWVHWRSKK